MEQNINAMAAVQETQIFTLLEERGKLQKKLVEYEEITKNIDAIDRVLDLLGYIGPKDITTPANNVRPIPTAYNVNLVWEDKCLFALNELGSGYSTEVAKWLIEKEPHQDPKTVG